MPPAWVIEEMNHQHDFCIDEDVVKEVTKSQPHRRHHQQDDVSVDATECESSSESQSSRSSRSYLLGSIVSAGDSEDSQVKFDLSTVSVHTCLGRHEMPETYLRDVWYRPSDFASISTWNRMTVKLFRQHEKELGGEEISYMDLGQECIRGLEHRLKGRNEERREMTVNAIYAVLGEQARQRKYSGTTAVKVGAAETEANSQALADVYKEQTRVSLASALEKARRDVEAATDEPSTAAEAPKSDGRAAARRRRSEIDLSNHKKCFDDTDVSTVQEDMITAVPVTVLDDDSSFRVKAKREKRGNISFSRFFKSKKSSKSPSSSASTTSDKDKAAAPHSPKKESTVSRRRRYRRSSM